MRILIDMRLFQAMELQESMWDVWKRRELIYILILSSLSLLPYVKNTIIISHMYTMDIATTPLFNHSHRRRY